MLALSVTLLAIAILAGIFLLTFLFLDGSTPRRVARTHGVIALLGLLVLITLLFFEPAHYPFAGAIVLAIAAAGGYALYRSDITKKPLPRWFPLAHACVAVAGFVMLVWFIM